MFKPVCFNTGIYSGILLLVSISNVAFAAANVDEPIIDTQQVSKWYQFIFENDAMSAMKQSDDGYSNGIAFYWGRSDYNDFSAIEMPEWLRTISAWTFINQAANKQYSIAYGLSQSMYTPDKIEESALIEDDRPYAGTLLWSSKIRSYANNRANSLGLTLGVAGPASLAEQSQTIIHSMIDATKPEGWDNQINNEFVFRIDAENISRFYRHSFSNDLVFDSSSYSEVGAGNLRSDVGTGLTLRIGNMLDQTYESINPYSSGVMSGMPVTNNKFYWQVFSTAYASYVFNDISLNGNTFSDSHSVELVHEQLMVSVGAAVLYNNWGAVFSIHRGNNQFEGQENVSKYGSLTISYHH